MTNRRPPERRARRWTRSPSWRGATTKPGPRESEAVLLELAAAIKERDGCSSLPINDRLAAALWLDDASVKQPAGAPPTSGNGLDSGQPACARSTPLHGAGNGLQANEGARQKGHYSPAPRGNPVLSTWPPEVQHLADEVRAVATRLKAAQCQRDFSETPILARKLRGLTAALEAAKLKSLAIPDLPSVGKPRMAGEVVLKSRFAAALGAKG
jgi:hypothetical protein